MPEVVVIDPELSVYAPVSSVDVAVSFGATGTRGSKQFVGAGAPVLGSTIPNSETVLLNDLYVDITTSNVYQYVTGTPSNQWSVVTRLAPLVYNVVKSDASFSSGTASFSYSINTMFGLTSTSNKFVVQHNIIGTTDPIVSVITEPTLSGTTLSFNIKGKSFNGTTWSDLSGTYKVMLSITVAVS